MDTFEAFKSRRAINFFDTERDVTDGELARVLETANLAPSSFNLQPWRVVVVRGAERRKALRACAMNQPKVEEAPVVLIVVADPATPEEFFDRLHDANVEAGMAVEEGREQVRSILPKLYGEPGSVTRAVFAAKNAGFFGMSVMIAARGLGLHTHPMDGFDPDCVRREFGIPEDKLVPMLICVGHLRPGVEIGPRGMRRPVDEFTGRDGYV